MDPFTLMGKAAANNQASILAGRIRSAIATELRRGNGNRAASLATLLSYCLSSESMIKELGFDEARKKAVDALTSVLLSSHSSLNLVICFGSWLDKQGDAKGAFTCLTRQKEPATGTGALYCCLGVLSEKLGKNEFSSGYFNSIPGGSPYKTIAKMKSWGSTNKKTRKKTGKKARVLRPVLKKRSTKVSVPRPLAQDLFPLSAREVAGSRSPYEDPVDDALIKGLDWLMRHQAARGYWDCDNFYGQCKGTACSGQGAAWNDVGITGLALLALVTSPSGLAVPGRDASIRKGIRYLVDIQEEATGQFGPRTTIHFNYCHGMASLALVEALGRTGNPALVGPVRRSLDYILSTRSPGRGWRYTYPPEGDSDTSLTSWMLNCLILGQRLGLDEFSEAREQGLAFFNEMTDRSTGIIGYLERGSFSARRNKEAMARWPASGSSALTAAALECWYLDGIAKTKYRSISKSLSVIKGNLPRWKPNGGRVDYYYWYYGSQLAHLTQDTLTVIWHDAVLEALIKGQEKKGCVEGSWNPEYDPWGEDGGRVYTTAMAIMCLIAPQRFRVEGF